MHWFYRAAFIMMMSAGLSDNGLARPMKYNCDTPSNHFSLLERPQSGVAPTASGSIVAKELYAGKFFPTANIRLQNADLKAYIGIRLSQQPNNKSKQLSMIIQVKLPGQDVREANVGNIDTGADVPFSLSRRDDQAVIELAGKTMTFPFPFSDDVIAGVSCSTGNFDFLNLNIDGS